MSTTITNLPETSKVNDSDYLVLDQPDKTVKSTVSNFLTDTGVVLATQLKDTDGATKYPELQISRWRDEGDPRGWGAVGDGITDDTASFTNLETNIQDRIIDLKGKSYLVTKSFTNNKYINGSFLLGTVSKTPIGDLDYKNDVLPLIEPGSCSKYSTRHTLRRTEGAGGVYAVIQGCCYDEVNDKIFTLSSTSAYGYCINAFSVTNAGELGTYDRTRSTYLGHQGLGLQRLADGSPVLWSSQPYADGSADQCVSMENILTYSGTTNGVTEGFITWQLFPATNDSGSSTPTVSTCGKYLIAKKTGSDGLTTTVRVFDILAMWENKTTKTDYSSDYLVEFTYQKPSADIFTQDLACDGHYIYILESGTAVGVANSIMVFRLSGEYVYTVDITTVGDSEAEADDDNSPAYKEPEAIYISIDKGVQTLTLGLCTYKGVEANGKNVYLFDLGRTTSIVHTSSSVSISDSVALHSSGNTSYKFGAKTYNNTYHWTVNSSRKGVITNVDNPVLALDGGITGGLQLASNGSEGMSNSWCSRHQADSAEGPRAILMKSRSGVVSTDSYGAVVKGDRLGTFVWGGDTGSNYALAATIQCNVMGAPVNGGVPTALYFGTTDASGSLAHRWVLTESGAFRPSGTNMYDLGTSSNTVKDLYINNSPIITSDRNYKQDEVALSATELAAGLAIAEGIKTFKMKAAVSTKGTDARVHIGIIAQEVQAAFEALGLDPFAYGILCQDTWEDVYENETAIRMVETSVVIDDETGETEIQYIPEEYETGNKVLVKEAGTKLSVRTDELMFLVVRAMQTQYDEKLATLEERLAALESK